VDEQRCDTHQMEIGGDLELCVCGPNGVCEREQLPVWPHLREPMRWRAIWSLTWLLCAHAAHAQSEEPSGESFGEVELPLEPSSSSNVQALSESELGALGLETSGSRVDTDFHLWGFADFSSTMLIRPPKATAAVQGAHQSFYIGSLNFYLSKNLSESFRTMAEVRLTYLPNGSYYFGADGFKQVDTSTVDYANGQSLTRWGGIILQRVYLEWTLHRLITVRGGQFLTPLGIWNVDHGSPAYIPAQRPTALVSGMFPERQMGLELLGRWGAGDDDTLGYHLTLSNGTGPISDYKDLDRNKAVGGRLYWEHFGSTYLRVGASGYYGRDTVSTPVATLMGATIDLGSQIGSQSDILDLAADLQLKHGGLTLQTEWITQQRRFTERGRILHTTFGAPVSNGASADTFSWAGYLLAAYRFSWYGLTPYATYQAVELSPPNGSLPDARFIMVGYTLGLNVSPIESVVFKAEYGYLEFVKATELLKNKVPVLQFQVAWAF
jgi:hypothetical protein